MRRSLAVATMLALLSTACNDESTLPNVNVANSSVARSRATAIDNFIIQLFPRGIETATGSRWDRIDIELGVWNAGAGQWTGPNSAIGRKHTSELIKFILQKTGDIDASALGPGETRAHAATRLIAAMVAYVLNGPGGAIPSPTADVTVAIIPPGAAAIVKSPSGHAGVSIPAGATSEERIIIVGQTPSSGFPTRCSGPLEYTGCQFPLFYTFESLPHIRLNVPARFAVCLDFSSPNAPTEAEHERVRLAHDLPDNAADYTPGATQVQGIEILPLIGTHEGDPPQQGFMDCEHPAPPPVIGFNGLIKRGLYELAELGAKVFSPKELYAYDQGPEHNSIFFSNFNAVDPQISEPCEFECGGGGGGGGGGGDTQSDLSNDPVTLTSYGCSTTGASLSQSFMPASSTITAVDLRLRAGGSFPSGGLTPTVRLRKHDGTLLGSTTASIAGGFGSGLVRFTFPDLMHVDPFDTYFIEWPSPTPEGQNADAILTWMGTSGNPYANGSAYGCSGLPIDGVDFNFKTYP